MTTILESFTVSRIGLTKDTSCANAEVDKISAASAASGSALTKVISELEVAVPTQISTLQGQP